MYFIHAILETGEMKTKTQHVCASPTEVRDSKLGFQNFRNDLDFSLLCGSAHVQPSRLLKQLEELFGVATRDFDYLLSQSTLEGGKGYCTSVFLSLDLCCPRQRSQLSKKLFSTDLGSGFART